MSNEQHSQSEDHGTLIKTPKQLITVVILAFIVPIIIIIMLVNFVATGDKVGAGGSGQTPESIAQRIQPVAQFEIRDPSAPRVFMTGEQVYLAVCVNCHSSGLLNAPKVGDNAAWGTLIGTGFDTMLGYAIKGKNNMPAKGGNADLDDFEIARAIVHMANLSGGSLPEPKEPAPAAPAAATDGAAATEATPAATK